MPLPKKQVLQEIVEAESQTADAPAVFLQEIKEPTHEEVLNEEPKKTRRKRKSK
jgi:hypothetical protein